MGAPTFRVATPITSLELRGLEMMFCSQTPSHYSEPFADAALLGRVISRKAVIDRAAHLWAVWKTAEPNMRVQESPNV